MSSILHYFSSLTCLLNLAVNVSFVDEKIYANESSSCVDVCVELTGSIERDVEVVVGSSRFCVHS